MDSSLSPAQPGQVPQPADMMDSSFHQAPGVTALLSSAQAPLYEIKANLFKGLAHPARIRILELLAAAPQETAAVSYLLAETGLEASHLSQHLATLRRHRVVTSVRTANAVTYQLAHPGVSQLL